MFALDKERETNQRMLDLDRAKGEFVSAVSHELRTPLTSIVGYTELLTDDFSANLTALQQQLVERIERNGERLLHLVEDLLTLARVEDGNLSLDRVQTDLRDAVRTATDEVAHAAHKGRVSLRVHLPARAGRAPGRPHAPRTARAQPGQQRGEVHPGGRLRGRRRVHRGRGRAAGGEGHRHGDPTGGAEPAVPAVLPFDPGHRERHPGHRARTAHRAVDRRGTRRQRGFESTPGVGTTFRFLLPTSVPETDEPGDAEPEDQQDEAQERDPSTDSERAELL